MTDPKDAVIERLRGDLARQANDFERRRKSVEAAEQRFTDAVNGLKVSGAKALADQIVELQRELSRVQEELMKGAEVKGVTINVGVDHAEHAVIIAFGKPVSSFGLKPDNAEAFARLVIESAEVARGGD